MVICAGQSIPQYYETESTTTVPACNCIGDEDNAYVIRRITERPLQRPCSRCRIQLPTPSVIANSQLTK